MLAQVAFELNGIGITPRIADFPNFSPSRQAVLIEVEVQSGRCKGKTLSLGLSFQEDAYPEYPPHFVHLKSIIRTDITTRHSVHQFEGEEWSAYSLPPSDFWDSLDRSEKNMKTYYVRHILRILDRL